MPGLELILKRTIPGFLKILKLLRNVFKKVGECKVSVY